MTVAGGDAAAGDGDGGGEGGDGEDEESSEDEDDGPRRHQCAQSQEGSQVI